MTRRYYLTDDSCDPIDIEALDVFYCDSSELDTFSWTYKSKEDVVKELEIILDKIKNEYF